jgi:uncharacterized protein YeaO (DUF488 family)
VIRTGGVYDPPSPDDGYRLLVMRLWPRGVKKESVDGWERELGPSLELLRAYRSGAIGWEAFAERYRTEMAEKPDLLAELSRRARRGTVTLLCTEEDDSRCHRSLLKGLGGQ